MKVLLFVLFNFIIFCAAKDVLTPFGWRPQNCVKEVPSGSHLIGTEEGVEAHLMNGTVLKFPRQQECVDSHANWRRLFLENHKNPKNQTYADGWLDNAFAWTGAKEIDSFKGDYLVPQDPTVDNGQVLFYFIGAVNFQKTPQETILQPVLTWGNGHSKWNMASWNCCPNGETWTSSFIENIPAGSTLNGLIDISSNAENWTVSSVFGNQVVNLTVPANDQGTKNFTWLDATLETYRVTQCSEFPTSPFVFSNMVATLIDGTPLTPSWNPTGPTECGGSLVVNDPSKITIDHSNSSKLLKNE